MKTVSKGIGKAFADTITEGKNLMEALANVGKAVINALIAQLIELGVQRILLSFVSKAAVATEASAEGARAASMTFGNQMASMSAAPFPINLTAPGVATAMTNIAVSGMAAAIGAGASVGAAAGAIHGGMDFVPKEATFLLNQGERVLSPNQNQDLTNFLSGSTGESQQVTIETIQMTVMENVVSIDNFMNMSVEEVKEVVADKIIAALDALDAEGVRPAFADRVVNV